MPKFRRQKQVFPIRGGGQNGVGGQEVSVARPGSGDEQLAVSLPSACNRGARDRLSHGRIAAPWNWRSDRMRV